MKRVTLCVLMLLLCLSVVVSAEEMPVATAVRAKGSVTIDGEFDHEWENAVNHVIRVSKDDPVVQEFGTVWNPDVFNAEGEFYFMWDEKNLYLFANIIDDAIYDSDPIVWLNDTVAVFMVDTDSTANFKLPIPASVASKRVVLERMNVNDIAQMAVRQMADVYAKITETGWCLEAALDWNKVFAAKIDIAAGKSLRFTPLLIDGRGPGGPKQNWGQAMWVGDGDCVDGSVYGWMKLVD
ncbi:MAG: sugar-binding protein [Limnochordia bacterium]|jgi:hypothetical protein|nr:sugar-binding protein [Limnochordia bacterium]